MKTLLFLSWLGMAGAGYYGYYGYNYYQQASDETLKLKQQLLDANSSNTDLSGKVSDLNLQVAALQRQLVEAKTTAAMPAPAPVAAPATPTEIPSTITTTYGQTYTGCVLSRVLPDGISFTHSTGVAKVLFSELDPSFAAKFGYDKASARQYEQAQAAHDAQSDAMRATSENKADTAPINNASVASSLAPAQAAPSSAVANQSQINDLQRQISSLQAEANQLDAQDVSDFNAPTNIYYTMQGQLEHRHTMGHCAQAVEDRNEIATLQSQVASLQGASQPVSP